MNDSAIEIAIDELALIDLPPLDRERLRAALAAELTRLLSSAVPTRVQATVAISRLNSGMFSMEAGDTVERIGAAIAEAVYGSLGGRT